MKYNASLVSTKLWCFRINTWTSGCETSLPQQTKHYKTDVIVQLVALLLSFQAVNQCMQSQIKIWTCLLSYALCYNTPQNRNIYTFLYFFIHRLSCAGCKHTNCDLHHPFYEQLLLLGLPSINIETQVPQPSTVAAGSAIGVQLLLKAGRTPLRSPELMSHHLHSNPRGAS